MKGPQKCPQHSKGPQPPEQVQSALTLSIQGAGVYRPVQLVSEVNTQVLVRVHCLNVRTQDVHRCQGGVSSPAEIHHQLFGLPCIELEVVPLAPVSKVLYLSSILPVILIRDEADNSRVI